MKKKVLMVFLICLLVFGFTSDAMAKKPKVSKEEKKAAKAAKKEGKIEEVMGTNANWKPKGLINIKKGMTCGEVSQFFRGINCGDPSPFKMVPEGLGTISDYKFYFMDGRLYSVTIIFGSRLFDEKSFNEALLNVLQRKWGPIQDFQNIVWKDSEFGKIEMKYNQTHWELEMMMPVYDPGDVDVTQLTEETLRPELQKFFGGPENCVPEYFTQFKYGTRWEEMQSQFPDLVYDATQTNNYCKVSVHGHPLVAGLELRFNSGILEYVKAAFHWQWDRELVKAISYEVLKEKYGSNMKDDDAVQDTLSIYLRDCGFAGRRWDTNRWEFDMTLPKSGGSKVTGSTAPSAGTSKTTTSKAAAGTAKTTTASTSAITEANLVGNWKLVAAKQGTATEKMSGPPERSVEFTSDQQFMMKEDGKAINTSYYKITSGKYLYFTSGKGGQAVKQIGSIVSLKGNQLVLQFSGQTIEMIFEKM